MFQHRLPVLVLIGLQQRLVALPEQLLLLDCRLAGPNLLHQAVHLAGLRAVRVILQQLLAQRCRPVPLLRRHGGLHIGE